MSAMPLIATMERTCQHVSNVPIADINSRLELAERALPLQALFLGPSIEAIIKSSSDDIVCYFDISGLKCKTVYNHRGLKVDSLPQIYV
jgi:hypothetical protein